MRHADVIQVASEIGKLWFQYMSNFAPEHDGDAYDVHSLCRFVVAARVAGVPLVAEDVELLIEQSGHTDGMQPGDATQFLDELLSEVDAINATLDILESEYGMKELLRK